MKLGIIDLGNYKDYADAKNSGAVSQVVPNRVETAGSDKAITRAAAGTTKSEAYLIENWKTFLSVSLSFLWLSLEKAGKSIVVIGVVKKLMRNEKLNAIPQLPIIVLFVVQNMGSRKLKNCV